MGKEKDREKEKNKISKNVVFKSKLSYQEHYPKVNLYKTPKYIKELKRKRKNNKKND